MKKILSILTVGCALTLSSCEDWLDKYPLAQMSPETFFSNENELQAFSNTFYTIFPCSNTRATARTPTSATATTPWPGSSAPTSISKR